MDGRSRTTARRRSRDRTTPRSARRAMMPLLIVLLLPALAVPQSWDVDWWTVDGGGEVLSETAGGQWQLSGTLGQWDSTASLALSGVGWTLSGGFWPVTVDTTDRIFSDGFE